MATAIIRPTAHYASSQITDPAKIYDNNESTYAKAQYDNRALLVYGFDASGLASALRSGAKITDIKFYIRARVVGTASVRLVRDATSISSYTDCGDDVITYGTFAESARWYSKSFPVATEYWNSNIEAFINGGLQVRIYMKSAVTLYYECYAQIEYEVPTINVTTSASPAEGGTVTGGGTYESGTTVTATATPNEGYTFSHWLVNGANAGNSNPISGALAADTTVTAVFVKNGVNKVYIGTAQPKEIYLGTQKVKGIYIGTTAVYET